MSPSPSYPVIHRITHMGSPLTTHLKDDDDGAYVARGIYHNWPGLGRCLCRFRDTIGCR